MLKTKQRQQESPKVDTYSTQEIVITKPLTALSVFISNIPEKDTEKSQAPAKKTVP